MVDAEDLLLCEGITDDAIELARGGEISAERYFNYDARPASFAGLVQACGFQVLEYRFELLRTGCEVKKAVAARAMTLVIFVKPFGQLLVTSFVTKLAPVIKNRLRKRLPDFVADRLARKLARGLFEVAPELVVTFVTPSESDDDYVGWQLSIGCQVIQLRDEFAMSEITRRAENYDATWLRCGPRGQSFAERVWFGLIRCAIHCIRRLRNFRRLDNDN